MEIDESVFRRRKYNRGRRRRQGWVFGAWDRETKLGLLQYVPDRSGDTLLPIIKEWCAPGTEIYSDGWAAYNSIEDIEDRDYEHGVVVHERHFVDPETGVCTNAVEEMWSQAKRKMKRMVGMHEHLIPTYLDEFMWLQRFGKTSEDAFQNMVEQIADFYRV